MAFSVVFNNIQEAFDTIKSCEVYENDNPYTLLHTLGFSVDEIESSFYNPGSPNPQVLEFLKKQG